MKGCRFIAHILLAPASTVRSSFYYVTTGLFVPPLLVRLRCCAMLSMLALIPHREHLEALSRFALRA
jgi:hypothetical protein